MIAKVLMKYLNNNNNNNKNREIKLQLIVMYMQTKETDLIWENIYHYISRLSNWPTNQFNVCSHQKKETFSLSLNCYSKIINSGLGFVVRQLILLQIFFFCIRLNMEHIEWKHKTNFKQNSNKHLFYAVEELNGVKDLYQQYDV